MTNMEFAAWGLAGGLLIELLHLASATRRHKTFPWLVPEEMPFWPYIYCATTRPAVGAVVAVALGSAGQVSGSWGALIVGAGAPLIIQNASNQFVDHSKALSVSDDADLPSKESVQTDITEMAGDPTAAGDPSKGVS